ncbi:MAG: orotidine 5'-phosphate decarboxylase / HUMPS family protein [Nanoarchaeota archaeon]
MDEGRAGYKREFIEFLLKTGALRVGGDYTLKSKRNSPWFVNIGDFNNGESIKRLGEYFADTILAMDAPFDILYGIPEKGNALAVATAIALVERDVNIPWFFTRKIPKDYGEATGTERKKSLVVGRAPQDGNRIVQLDDVFTAGNAKYEARDLLNSLGTFELPFLTIAVDRQEVGIKGFSAIEEYEIATGTRVTSAINATDIYSYLLKYVPIETPNGTITLRDVQRMGFYLKVYGTNAIRDVVGDVSERIIQEQRSVIPACDVERLEDFEELVKVTADIPGIGAYKIGFELGLGYGLERVVATARKHTDKPIIYDHQKAGTDIPDTGKNFARTCKNAGVDAVILFPQAGPETERSWIYHALEQGLQVIVGGWMTHAGYAKSEGGFIDDESILDMYRIAARAGITQFVVPGNKPEIIKHIKETIAYAGVNPIFFAPGFVAQGGAISDAANVAGDSWHAIIGRGITDAEDKREAALAYTKQL